jgi:predicted flap endonuclease-1-like 5' DNA nuclease
MNASYAIRALPSQSIEAFIAMKVSGLLNGPFTVIQSEREIAMSKKVSTLNTKAGQPAETDDLKLINGIGPAVEKRLHGVGIFTFAQLAVLSSADIAAAVADLSGLSAERIIKQDWIGQARKLAAESAASEARRTTTLPIESEKSMEPYELATFTVEFLLDEHNNVRSTHALHVQSKREQTWTGWPKTQLVDFLSESTGQNKPSDEPDLLNTEEPDHVPAIVTESEPLTQLAAKPRLTGTLYVPKMEMIGVESAASRRTLAHDEPFDVRLTLDLSELQVPGNAPLNYKTSIYGKGRGRPGLVIGEAQGSIIPRDRVAITVGGNTLPEEGIYQLTATVILGLPTMKLAARPGTTAIVDGGLLEVY